MQTTLAKCLTTTCTFNLWMSKGAHNVFAMVMKFLSTNWKSKHINIGLFKAHEYKWYWHGCEVETNLWQIFTHTKNLAYVKTKGSNLQTCAKSLKLVVSYDDLGIVEPLDGFCYGHVLSNMLIWHFRWKGLWITFCINQNCPSGHPKKYHVAEEIWQREASVGKNVCGF